MVTVTSVNPMVSLIQSVEKGLNGLYMSTHYSKMRVDCKKFARNLRILGLKFIHCSPVCLIVGHEDDYIRDIKNTFKTQRCPGVAAGLMLANRSVNRVLACKRRLAIKNTAARPQYPPRIDQISITIGPADSQR